MTQAQYLERIESVKYSFRENWKEWELKISPDEKDRLKDLASKHKVSLKEFADNFSRKTAYYLIKRGVLLGPSPKRVWGSISRYYTFKKDDD